MDYQVTKRAVLIRQHIHSFTLIGVAAIKSRRMRRTSHVARMGKGKGKVMPVLN
jgi:hypothetical protein